MIRIEFVPYEELTSEDWDRIIEGINMYGDEVKVIESEEDNDMDRNSM